jgi:magnesium-protoporphyrin O-methyltransferase
MPTVTYLDRRGEIETYFDRTAVDAWTKLTSDAPVSRIRKTVRAGRDQMRSMLLSWLPVDLSGRRILDAGCGTGAFATEAARRGASVVAVDISPKLVELAARRSAEDLEQEAVDFRVGDMLDPALGRFDHVIAMDSLIHYTAPDIVKALEQLAARTRSSVLFTYAPKTPLLALMHSIGRAFPRTDRAPAIEPVSDGNLKAILANETGLMGWRTDRTARIANGFYTSQAMELIRA